VSAWVANTLALALSSLVVLVTALALLWRVGAWRMSPAASLNLDEGLTVGTQAPELAAIGAGQEVHLSFIGSDTFIAFGVDGCAPCRDLIEVAARHPATRHMRRVYVTDNDIPVAGDALDHWEIYRFIDEKTARRQWRAPVSPYFHLVDAEGRIVDKGLGSKPEHLDRLLFLKPPSVRARPSTRANA
jgi:hypothetical protein